MRAPAASSKRVYGALDIPAERARWARSAARRCISPLRCRRSEAGTRPSSSDDKKAPSIGIAVVVEVVEVVEVMAKEGATCEPAAADE